ncbi:MAG: putative RNA dependent RNA polymerase [Hanko totivirus 9]|nr:MAG: putative RNA dependent RNA polymerase [Hanko totivirus 9]
MITMPHLCTITRLKEVEQAYASGYISSSLYDRWLSMNGGDYQLGNSEVCLKLWDSWRAAIPKRQRPHDDRLDDIQLNPAVVLMQCKKHRGWYVRIKWSKVKKPDDLNCLNEIWQFSSKADQTKTSISAKNMVWHIKQHAWAVKLYDQYEWMFSTSYFNITATAMLIHLVGNPSFEAMAGCLKKYDVCCLDMSTYASLFKLWSVALRRTSRWPDGRPASLQEVTGCAAWELAIGRSNNVSDWEEEEHKRTKCYVPLSPPELPNKSETTNEMYIRGLTKVLDQILVEMVRPFPSSKSFLEFCQTRQSWMSSGSTGGAKANLSDGSQVRINKHAYFEGVSTTEMLSWIKEEPKISAVGSEKFEMGKGRAIYGTKPPDYVITSYSIADVEEAMFRVEGIESGLLGLDVTNAMFQKYAAVKSERKECTMVDYADFNYQHTLRAQSVVFEALAKRLEQLDYHPDKVEAALWVSKGLLNQWCKFPSNMRKEKQITQGMFSGCRATHFLNTTLNVGYYRYARDWVARNLHLFPVNLLNVHQGDDVWISNDSRLWAMVLFNVMQSSGLIFQNEKQLFGVQVGEFLRVVYTDQGCNGYVARAVNTLIVKPIQSVEVVGPAERATAINDQLQILYRRGLTQRGIDLLWNATVPYAATSSFPSGTFSIPIPYLKMRFDDNGLDLGPPLTMAKKGGTVAAIPVIEFRSAELERCIDSKMSKDWVNYASSRIKKPILSDKWVDILHRANIMDSLRMQDRMAGLKELERMCVKWKKSLSLPQVCRNRLIYSESINGEIAPDYFEDVLNTLERGDLAKQSVKVSGTLSLIFRALNSSPFKGLANAMIATGLGKVEAAEVAISTHYNLNTRRRAGQALQQLKENCGLSVTAVLVDEVRTGTTVYQGELHPTMLSWIKDYAMDYAVRVILQKQMKDANIALEFIITTVDRFVRSARKRQVLLDISHY